MRLLDMPLLSVASWLLVASVASADSHTDHVTVSYQPGSPRQCFAEFGETGLRIDVLPGRGWDNLRNVEQSSVLAYNYSKCHTTYDGAHLLPDHMSAIPLLQSKVDTHTEVFDRISNYTSLTANSINSDITVYSVISGYFSSEYESFKQRVVSQQSVKVRVQLRHLRYKIRSHPSSTLNPAFKHRLMQIAASIQSNLTEMATYLSQLLVRDYGTHYTHTTHVGAVLVKNDFLSRDQIQDRLRDKVSISSGAQADFFGKVKLGFEISFKHETTQLNEYRKAIQSTSIETYGGPMFTTNMTVTDWEAGVESAMVAVDRDGDPIHFLINPDTLPEIPPSTVIMVAQYVKQAADKYYSINTHRGCTDFSSPNFDYFANIDDGTCKDTSQNFTFGGVYQTCRITQGDNLCGRLEQKNPLTQDYSCPSGYTAIQLMTGKESYTTNKPRCWNTYKRCGFLWLSRCSSGRACQTDTVTSIAIFETFWCAKTSNDAHNHYYFGGIYTTSIPNPLTRTHGCPNHFQSLKFTSKGHVCVSGDNELGRPQSLPFGGFHSCDAGNPLTKSKQRPYPKSCPEGFSQHLALVDDDCEIKYCLRSGALSSILETPIQRPPYMDLPDSFMNKTKESYIFDMNGNIWANTRSDKQWRVITPQSADYETAVNKFDETLALSSPRKGEDLLEHPINAGLLGTAIGVGLLALLLIFICSVGKCVCYCRKRRRQKKQKDLFRAEHTEAGGGREDRVCTKDACYVRLESGDDMDKLSKLSKV